MGSRQTPSRSTYSNEAGSRQRPLDLCRSNPVTPPKVTWHCEQCAWNGVGFRQPSMQRDNRPPRSVSHVRQDQHHQEQAHDCAHGHPGCPCISHVCPPLVTHRNRASMIRNQNEIQPSVRGLIYSTTRNCRLRYCSAISSCWARKASRSKTTLVTSRSKFWAISG
jgi:hypothetical protein